MRRTISIIFVVAVLFSFVCELAYANSRKTWSNIGKGLAIYEGVKVLTGREGNIVQDVTGGMKPTGGSSQQAAQPAGSYEDAYNAGYRKGYEEGYNAGFRAGVQHEPAAR